MPISTPNADFLKPPLEPALDVGCGVGQVVKRLDDAAELTGGRFRTEHEKARNSARGARFTAAGSFPSRARISPPAER